MDMYVYQSRQQVLACHVDHLGLRIGRSTHSGHDAVLHQHVGTDERSAGIYLSPFEQLFHRSICF